MPLIQYTPPYCPTCTPIRRRSYRVSRPLRPCRTSIARAPLYMACLVAIQHNPVLKRFYRRLELPSR
jgi:hypothetical protein